MEAYGQFAERNGRSAHDEFIAILTASYEALRAALLPSTAQQNGPTMSNQDTSEQSRKPSESVTVPQKRKSEALGASGSDGSSGIEG